MGTYKNIFSTFLNLIKDVVFKWKYSDLKYHKRIYE